MKKPTRETIRKRIATRRRNDIPQAKARGPPPEFDGRKSRRGSAP